MQTKELQNGRLAMLAAAGLNLGAFGLKFVFTRNSFLPVWGYCYVISKLLCAHRCRTDFDRMTISVSNDNNSTHRCMHIKD
jgi:hypothetical protein